MWGELYICGLICCFNSNFKGGLKPNSVKILEGLYERMWTNPRTKLMSNEIEELFDCTTKYKGSSGTRVERGGPPSPEDSQGDSSPGVTDMAATMSLLTRVVSPQKIFSPLYFIILYILLMLCTQAEHVIFGCGGNCIFVG